MTDQTKIPAESSPSPLRKRAILTASAVALLAAGWWLWAPDAGSVATEDAYVEGHVVQVTPQVAGSVVAIGADNTDYVQAGQVLVRLNDVDAKLAVARAEAQLAKAVRQVRAQFAGAGQAGSTIVLRRADLDKASADLARRRELEHSGAVSGEDVRHAEDAVKVARAALAAAEQQGVAANALVDRTTVDSHPDVQAAAAQLRDAYVALERTTLRAPVHGLVARRAVQLGQRVAPGAALMAVVPPEQVWVGANFKEAQLRDIRIGQPVTLVADVYGKQVRYRGRVAGSDAGTGNAFSLLPAQNATGNWIKVVQRVPVRIALDPRDVAAHPLKIGLSMRATVDTTDRRGTLAASAIASASATQTAVFDRELAQADERVRRIIGASRGGAH